MQEIADNAICDVFPLVGETWTGEIEEGNAINFHGLLAEISKRNNKT